MSFPTYPAYKDSGVKWLSDVPEHWHVRRNKQVFRLVSVQVGNKSADFQLLSLTLRGVIPRDMESGKGKFPAEFDTYQVVEPGDIVFCLFDIDETPRTVGISSNFGMITGAYTVAKTLPVADPRFIYYYYFSIDLRKGLRPFYTGLRKVVRPETFLNIELPLPPLSEQANICNFLDHETARIDALIEEQQRLIELLKEKRQAVISHAVTKGLDPTVPMKDSGVEWLGEVPAHWDFGSFRRAIKSVSNGTTADQVDEDANAIAVSRIETISTGEINFEKVGYVKPEDAASRFILKCGDILFSHINSLSMIGNVALYRGSRPLLHGMNLLRIQPASGVMGEWIFYWLKSKNIRQEVESRAKPAINQASISTDSVRSLPVLIPPESEQIQIVRHLDCVVARIDTLTQETVDLVALLQERRSALISAAVTGKIDVRGWQPPASTQTPEFEVAEAH